MAVLKTSPSQPRPVLARKTKVYQKESAMEPRSASSPENNSLSVDVEDSRETSPATSTSDQPANKSKAGIRVSLACVPCRSKHIKCDATLPTCLRCQLEQKPCYYARSRRGIRDPKKRSMISDKQPGEAASAAAAAALPAAQVGSNSMAAPWPLPQVTAFNNPTSVRYVPHEGPAGWSLGRRVTPPSSPNAAAAFMLDLYYVNFYPSTPITLPKQYMVPRLNSTQSDMHFLMSVISFVGSLYEPSISSDGLREAAYSQACGPLPMTPSTVQGLLIVALVGFGEDKSDLAIGWLDRAIQISLDLGMQHKSFADSQADPIVAESYRRTYWALYIQDCTRASGLNSQVPFSLFNVRATTDIPCEEWEYQSGAIPPPISLEMFSSQVAGEESDFSSWAYSIELCRIMGESLFPLKVYHEQPWVEEVERIDLRIQGWLHRIPKWKQEAISPHGIADLTLYIALGMAHCVRIRIRQPMNRLQLGVLRDGFPLGPLSEPERARTPLSSPELRGSWHVVPPELQAGNALCHLLTYPPVTPVQLFPINVRAFERLALAYLDGAVFLGCDSPALRERLKTVIAMLRKNSEYWPVARRVLREVLDLVAVYLPQQPMTTTSPMSAAATVTAAAMAVEDDPTVSWQGVVFDDQTAAAAAAAAAAGASHHHSHHGHHGHPNHHPHHHGRGDIVVTSGGPNRTIVAEMDPNGFYTTSEDFTGVDHVPFQWDMSDDMDPR